MDINPILNETDTETERRSNSVEGTTSYPNAAASTPVDRDERRPIDPAVVGIDNVALNHALNSIIQPQFPNLNFPLTLPSMSPFLAPPACAAPQQTPDSSPAAPSSTQYLLPVDLVVSVNDKTKQSTIQAALPASYAFNSVPHFPSIALPQSVFSPSPWMSGLTPMPIPSVPSVLASQPNSCAAQSSVSLLSALQSTPKSTLNPSAVSFTPYTPCTPVAPIVEYQNDEEIDQFAITETKTSDYNDSGGTNHAVIQRKLPSPTRSTSPHSSWLQLDECWENDDADLPAVTSKLSRAMISPSFPKQTADCHSTRFHSFSRNDRFRNHHGDVHREFDRNWRSSTPKSPRSLRASGLPRSPRSPRVRRPASRAINGGVPYSRWRTRTKPKSAAPLARYSGPKLLIEFVRHVTLGNRQEFAPHKLLTKTWAMRNAGEVEWGNDMLLVFCKGDRALTVHESYPVMNAQPGQEVEVSVTLQTGTTAGRMCAYFRLQKNGKFVGPRVWADVIVAAAGGDFQEQPPCRVEDKLGANKIRGEWKKAVSVQ